MKVSNNSNAHGFTLIELVIFIIILGILAAVALPKFVDLQGDAREAVVKEVSGTIHAFDNLVYAKSAILGIENNDRIERDEQTTDGDFLSMANLSGPFTATLGYLMAILLRIYLMLVFNMKHRVIPV